MFILITDDELPISVPVRLTSDENMRLAQLNPSRAGRETAGTVKTDPHHDRAFYHDFAAGRQVHSALDLSAALRSIPKVANDPRETPIECFLGQSANHGSLGSDEVIHSKF
jgi:hypothetical protein